MTRHSRAVFSGVSATDNQTPVAENIGGGRDQTRFTGKIREVTIEVK
jgi:hypothetical protein